MHASSVTQPAKRGGEDEEGGGYESFHGHYYIARVRGFRLPAEPDGGLGAANANKVASLSAAERRGRPPPEGGGMTWGCRPI